MEADGMVTSWTIGRLITFVIMNSGGFLFTFQLARSVATLGTLANPLSNLTLETSYSSHLLVPR